MAASTTIMHLDDSTLDLIDALSAAAKRRSALQGAKRNLASLNADIASLERLVAGDDDVIEKLRRRANNALSSSAAATLSTAEMHEKLLETLRRQHAVREEHRELKDKMSVLEHRMQSSEQSLDDDDDDDESSTTTSEGDAVVSAINVFV